MITAAQCKTYLSECEMLQRATAILAVRRASWHSKWLATMLL
jgi:hypothetical protein